MRGPSKGLVISQLPREG